MKFMVRAVLLLFAGLLVAGLAVEVLRLRIERGDADEQIAMLKKRVTSLRAHEEVLAGDCVRLEGEIAQAAARSAESLDKYKVERDTHEPLRRQIEKLLASEILYKDRLSRVDKDLRALRDSENKAAQEIAALKVDLQKATAQRDDLQARHQKTAESENGLRQELDKAKKLAAELEKKAMEADSVLATVRTQLAVAEKERAALAAEAEKIRKDLADRDARLKEKDAAAAKLQARLQELEAKAQNAPPPPAAK